MAKYLIGEVEKLTEIKAHVLRYWEEVIPCFSPQKDVSGRRIYSERDVEMIRRLKFLIYKKGYSIEGARKQIIQEASVAEDNMVTMTALKEIREQLNEMIVMLKKSPKTQKSKSRKTDE